MSSSAARRIALVVGLGIALALAVPAVASAALGQPSIEIVQTHDGWATVGWWAPGVPLSGWDSELQYSADPSFTAAVSLLVAGEPIEDYGEYTLSPMTNGVPYYFRVRSTDGVLWSTWSDTLSVTVYPSPPGPTWIFGSAGSKRAYLSWNPSARASRYQVLRATNSSFTSGVLSVYDGPALKYTNTGLTKGKTYYYKVRGIDPWSRTGTWSNVAAVKAK